MTELLQETDLLRGTGRTTRLIQSAIDMARSGKVASVAFVSASFDQSRCHCSLAAAFAGEAQGTINKLVFPNGCTIRFLGPNEKTLGIRHVIRDHAVGQPLQ